MNELKIKATEDTPEIDFDPEEGVFRIIGSSFPENTFEFYKPIIVRLEEHLAEIKDQPFTCHFEIMYYNSSTTKVFMNIFQMLNDAAAQGKQIVVNWYYDEDDEDSIEEGEEFKHDLEDVTFNIVEKSGT